MNFITKFFRKNKVQYRNFDKFDSSRSEHLNLLNKITETLKELFSKMKFMEKSQDF